MAGGEDSEVIDALDPSTYQGMPLERWKMVMVEHVAALRKRVDELERLRSTERQRDYRAVRSDARARKLQARLDEAQNTIAGLQRRLMEVQELNKPAMKEAV